MDKVKLITGISHDEKPAKIAQVITHAGPNHADPVLDVLLSCHYIEEIVSDSVDHSLQGKTPEEVFQQDNDPKHTSEKAKTWLADHVLWSTVASSIP